MKRVIGISIVWLWFFALLPSAFPASEVEGNFKELNREGKTIKIQPNPKVVQYAIYRLADDFQIVDTQFRRISEEMLVPDSKIILTISENRVIKIVLVQKSS